MTRTTDSIFAIAAALLLTVVTFHHAVTVPTGPAPVAVEQLA